MATADVVLHEVNMIFIAKPDRGRREREREGPSLTAHTFAGRKMIRQRGLADSPSPVLSLSLSRPRRRTDGTIPPSCFVPHRFATHESMILTRFVERELRQRGNRYIFHENNEGSGVFNKWRTGTPSSPF